MHTGYETKTPWAAGGSDEDDGDAEAEAETEAGGGVNAALIAAAKLEDSTRQMLREFFHPYNERLFSQTGHRCDW